MKEEKTIELKTKVEKVSDEHLKELQELVNALNKAHFNIGKLEAQKHTILHGLASTQDKVSVMQDTLRKEYGTDDVNVVNGKINWPEEKEEAKDEK